MHYSRLVGIVIDCKTDDVEDAARFWGAALGRDVTPSTPEEPLYRELDARRDEDPVVLVQKVTHESRVHLDIETDDMDAEVARLEKLGAKRIAFVRRWWVMEAPTGQRFCVVRPQQGGASLQARGNRWD